MGIVIKQSAYASLINYVGVVLGAVNIIFLFPVFLSKEEFGLMRAMLAMGITLAPFAQMGLARTTLRYIPRFSASEQTRGRFFAMILMLGGAAFGIFLVLFFLFDDWIFSFFSEKAPELKDQYWLILTLAFLLVYISILESYYKSLLNVVIPTFMKEFFLRISGTLLAFLFFYHWIDFSLFLKLTVGSYAFSLLTLVLILAFKKQLNLSFSVFRIEKGFFKIMIRYSLIVMAGAIGTTIILQIDQLMVTSYLGLASNAVYAVAFFMATVVDIPRKAIAQMSDSLIAKAFEFERIDEVKKLYKQSSINQLIIGCFVFLGIVLNLDNIYEIMPKGDDYSNGAIVVIIIGLAKLIDMGFGVNSEIIVSSKLYKANIYFVVILAILTVGLNTLLIPTYGLTGAALATLLAILCFNLLKMFYIWRYLKFQPFSWKSLIVLAYTTAIYFLVLQIPSLNNVYLNTLLVSSCITLTFIIATLAFKPSREVHQLMRTALKYFRKE